MLEDFLQSLKISRDRLRSRLSPRDLNAPDEVFLAPQFRRETVRAIRRISTHLSLKANERSRILWQADNNAMSQREYEALLPIFSNRPWPLRVLEIGPGFGRSAVFFSRKKVWSEDATLDLYDADGHSTKYKQRYYDAPPLWPDISSFCGDLKLLNAILSYNKLSRYRIFDAAASPLSALPGPYDLVYGFFSIGYHWSIEHYLEEIDTLLRPTALFICTLNKQFMPFAALNHYSTRVLECPGRRPGERPFRLLLLSKSELPPESVR